MQKKIETSIKEKKILFDTSAIIALLKKEAGYDILEDLIASSSITSVNLCELVTVLIRSGINENEIDEIVSDLVPNIILCNEEIAIKAGKLIKHTEPFGLSLGDRVCIATGLHYNMNIYTADKDWAKLNADIKRNIIFIR